MVEYLPVALIASLVLGSFLLFRRIQTRRQRATERYLRAIIQTEPECVTIVSPDGTLLDMNPAGLRMIEADSLAEVQGLPVSQLLLPEHRAEYATFHEAVRRGESGTLQFEIVGLKGTRRWLESHAAQLRDEDGVVTSTLSITRDITERRQAEQSLRESAQRLQQHNAALVELATSETIVKADLGTALKTISECAARTMHCERVSVWLFDERSSEVRCTELFERGPGKHSAGSVLRSSDYPAYFEALATLAGERVLAAHDAHRDPRTSEFSGSYLDPLGITSMLDAPVRLNGRMVGVICHEHVGPQRRWHADEESFAASMADFASLALQIQAKKHVEEALAEREHAYAMLLKNLTGMVYRCENDADWTATYVSAGCVALTDYQPEDLIGNRTITLGSLMHADDVGAIWEKCQRKLTTRQPCSNEYRIRTASGAVKWVWDQAQGVYSESGELMYVEGYLSDITARKVAEQESLAAIRALQLVIDAVPGYVSLVDADQRYQLISRSYEQWFGRPRAEITGRSLSEMHTPEAHEEMRPFVDKALAGEFVRYEFQYAAPSGQNYWFDCRYVPRVGQDDRVTGFLALILDVTEQKQAEAERMKLDQQVRHAQKLESLGVLAGGIAHDFNNLLTAVMGNIGLALTRIPPSSAVHGYLLGAEKATERAADLSRQMLAYSGRGRFVVERVDLQAVVEEMSQMLQVAISKDATMRFDFAATTPNIEADVTQLRQIILNLVTNASDAIGDHAGVIAISTGAMHCTRADLTNVWLRDALPEGEYAYLEVADTGCGIAADQLANIFDPFFTTKFTGRGLGLASVLGIVRGHKGTLSVHSEVGKGTIFRVLFPAILRPIQTAPSSETAVPVWRGRGCVLIVDDEPGVRETGTRMLESIGIEVLSAEDGRHALDIVAAQGARISVVLLDLTMPQMSGEETYRELRRLRPDLPIVLSSGYSEEDVVARFNDEGFFGFLPKPFTLAKMKSVLHRALANDSIASVDL